MNLANPLKIEIILSLREKERNVSELARNLKVEQSKVSHALASLRCCKIVVAKQKGKLRVYSLNKKTIVPILKIIDKHAKTFCNGECKGCRVISRDATLKANMKNPSRVKRRRR